MKKLLLSSVTLILFSFSIILFEISCKKETAAQQTNNCSETATVIFTVNLPANTALNPGDYTNNYLELHWERVPNNFYNADYGQYFTDITTPANKTFKNVIPGNYRIACTVGSKYTSELHMTFAAGQTYNITINSTDFH